MELALAVYRGRGSFPRRPAAGSFRSVWLDAWGPGMKLTHFPDRCPASSTRHSENLLRGEFLGFQRHNDATLHNQKDVQTAHVRHT
jgi:hypothetical protein